MSRVGPTGPQGASVMGPTGPTGNDGPTGPALTQCPPKAGASLGVTFSTPYSFTATSQRVLQMPLQLANPPTISVLDASILNVIQNHPGYGAVISFIPPALPGGRDTWLHGIMSISYTATVPDDAVLFNGVAFANASSAPLSGMTILQNSYSDFSTGSGGPITGTRNITMNFVRNIAAGGAPIIFFPILNFENNISSVDFKIWGMSFSVTSL